MKFIILILIFISIFAPAFVFAEDSQQIQLPKTSVNPGSFYYPFKRLIEKGRERLNFSQEAKISFYKSQIKIRFAELDYITEKKILSEVQKSSERFAYTAGILADEVGKSKGGERDNLIKDFEKYGKFLEGVRDRFPANSSFWMLIQHDINTLTILSDELK